MRDRMWIVIIAIFLLAAMGHVALAADTNYNETYCRNCHGNTVDRHHFLFAYGKYQCEDCHTMKYDNQNQTYYPEVIRNCLICHPNQNHIDCISCHDLNGSSDKKIDLVSFGMHININNTDGGLTNADCKACHFDTENMNDTYVVQPGVNVRVCKDCHVNQNVTSPAVSEHYSGANVNVTTMKCENCHSNSLNIPDPASTVNTTLGNVTHYSTTTNLLRPTANNTSKPRFGFMNQADASAYNAPCNYCHSNAANKTIYGVQNKQVTLGHTSTGACNECHVNSSSSADTLHNVSLEMPLTTNCLACHTTYASKYGAPNLIGTSMASYTTCNGGNCHGNDITNSLDTLARHNVDRTKAGTGGSTDTVYLNNLVSLSVTKGVPVNITSRVNDAPLYGGASRIRGAEYYIDVDPGQGKGIPMDATDGSYDALLNAWENVNKTIDTSSLSGGTHVIYVRGMDIGKQWSAPKNATLIVQAFGYINGTVTNGTGALISGGYVSTSGDNDTTGSDGKYSLIVSDGNYTVNASKLPEFYDYSEPDVFVEPLNTTTVDIVMDQKPTGTISGDVTNI